MNLFSDFDFALLDSPDFKEDSVRERLVTPLLNALGYSAQDKMNRIIRSKTLTHPFIKIDANTHHKTKSILNYLMEVDSKPVWILEAKSPKKSLRSPSHREKVCFCANHPDVAVNQYALCNGREFVLFHIDQNEPILSFRLADIEMYWDKMVRLLAPDVFQIITMPAKEETNVVMLIEHMVDTTIIANRGATIVEINNVLIMRGLEMGFLDVLSQEYQDVSPFLEANYDYDRVTKQFHMRPNSKAKAQIDPELRIRYYLTSYLRKAEKDGNYPTSDEIVWRIMPSLKNGTTPETQTILNVLERIASQHNGGWRLINGNNQINLGI